MPGRFQFHPALAALAFVGVQLLAGRTLAAIGLSVCYPRAGQPCSPLPNSVQGTSLDLQVTVTSTYAVQSVTAQAGSVSGNLSGAGSAWTGTLAIGSLSFGTQMLTVTATDVLNNTSSVTVSFFHHNPPAIQVTSPGNWAVAHPTVNLAATCFDDTGCRGFQVSVNVDQKVLARGQNSINQTGVDLSSFNGQVVVVVFSADDSFEGEIDGGTPQCSGDGDCTNRTPATKCNQLTGQCARPCATDSDCAGTFCDTAQGACGNVGWTTTVSQQVYVDTSNRLIPQATVHDGMILDFDPNRILYRKSDNSVVIRDRRSQVDTRIGTALDSGSLSPAGFLTSVGAAWLSIERSCIATAFDWHGGTPTEFAQGCNDVYGGYPVVIAGDWAMVYNPSLGSHDVVMRDLTTGTNTTHPFPVPTDDAGTQGGLVQAIAAANGDILGFVQSPDLTTSIYRDRGGTLTLLGTSKSTGYLIEQPLIDGIHLLYNVDTTNGPGPDSIALFANGSEQLIGQPRSTHYQPYIDYQINGGWVALRQVAAGINQVWVRAPNGATTQLSIFNTDSTIDAISAAGAVTFINGNTRYERIAPALPDAINSSLGTAVSMCDGLYIKMGGTLFKVSGTEDAGAGCPASDGGAPGVGEAGPDSGGGVEGGLTDASASGDVYDAAGDVLMDNVAVDSTVDAGVVEADSGAEASAAADASVQDHGGRTEMLDATAGAQSDGAPGPATVDAIAEGGAVQRMAPAAGGNGGGGCQVANRDTQVNGGWLAGMAALAGMLTLRRRRFQRAPTQIPWRLGVMAALPLRRCRSLRDLLP